MSYVPLILNNVKSKLFFEEAASLNAFVLINYPINSAIVSDLF